MTILVNCPTSGGSTVRRLEPKFNIVNVSLAAIILDEIMQQSCEYKKEFLCLEYVINGFKIHIDITKYETMWLLMQPQTRTPAFWGYPPPPHGYPHYWVILDLKSKKDVKATNLKNLPKFQIF